MALKDISTCIGAYDFSSSGFSGGQLLDTSGFGNHMDIVGAASPTFITRNGHEMTDFDNTYFYEGYDLLGVNNSVIVIAEVNMNSVTQFILASVRKKVNAGNFDGVPYDNTELEIINNTYRRKGIMLYASSLRFNDPSGTSTYITPPVGTPFLSTMAVDLEGNELQISLNEGAIASNAYTNNIGIGSNGAFMRIGFLREDGTSPAVGRYISVKEMYFFSGNVFEHPDFAAERATAVAAL